jgi:hypothetical protein
MNHIVKNNIIKNAKKELESYGIDTSLYNSKIIKYKYTKDIDVVFTKKDNLKSIVFKNVNYSKNGYIFISELQFR